MINRTGSLEAGRVNIGNRFILLWPTGRGWIEEYLAGELGMQPEEAAQGLMLIVPIDTRRLWLRALDILIEKGAISMLEGDVRAVYTAVAKTLGT